MRLLCLLVAACIGSSAHGHEISTDDWVRLGEGVHGGYGSLIAVGVRIGLDARERLSAQARDLDVTNSDGEKTPCACVLDGIMKASAASPGQGSLRVATLPAPAGVFGSALVRHRKTGAQLRYTIPAAAFPALDRLNREADARGRHEGVMRAPADTWFQVERITQ